MGGDIIEHSTGEFSRAVFVKGGSGDPSIAPGTIDSVTVAPTFTVASLAGYGNDYFNGWFAYVVWDSAGGSAAPQGESQVITDYVSSTGAFAHAAFTAALVAGDKMLISVADPTLPGDATAANQTTIITETDKLKGDEITGNTGAILHATETDCSAVIGQSGERAILQGGIVRGIQLLAAGKKATIRVYKYNGGTWDLVDSFDVTKDSLMEANIGQATHNDYMRVSVEHDDNGGVKTFTYVFVTQDME